MSKKVAKPSRPNRDPDHYSKRGVPYWWSPEWVRGTSGDTIFSQDDAINHPNTSMQWFTEECKVDANGRYIKPCPSYGKIHAVKKGNKVELYMLSKDGNLSYIQGSIQKEFIKWHEDRQIDYMLLGEDPDELLKDLSLESSDT